MTDILIVDASSTTFEEIHDSSAYELCTYKAHNLGAEEIIHIQVAVGSNWEPVVTNDNNTRTSVPLVFAGPDASPYGTPNTRQVVLVGDKYKFIRNTAPTTLTLAAKLGQAL